MRRFAWLSVLLSMGCGSPTPEPADASLAMDAGNDAAATSDAGADADLPAPVPLSLALAEPTSGYRFELDTDPLAFRIVDASGSTVVTSAGLGLAVGAARRGDQDFYEPMQDVPRGIRWISLAHGVERVSDTEARVRDDEGHEASLTLASEGPGEITLHVAMSDAATEAAMMRLVLAMDDGHYDGLGERFEGSDARGHRVPMQLSVTARARESSTNEAHVPVPFLVSSNGYGVFVETREAGAFDVGATSADEMRASFDGTELDLHFYLAPRPADVVAAYTRHTGLPILPPRWSFAPQHWRNEWTDRAELEGDVATIRSLDIPVTAFWIDNPWQTSYNDHVFDASRFPDPPGMLAWMRAQGLRTLVWTTPYLDAPEAGMPPANRAEQLWTDASAQHLLITDGSSTTPLSAPSASGCCDGGGMMDFTSEAAIGFWQDQLDPLVGLGVRAFKLDYGEDVIAAIGPGYVHWGFSDGRSNRELHNVYATLYHEPYRRALDEGSTEGGFLLARAEAWGGQTVTDVIWPGDLDSDMSVTTDTNVGGLPASVSALISLAASGFPSFAADTGGFRTAEDTPDGRPSRETLLRWAEHDAFSPFLQLGGGGSSHNPWTYDAEAASIYAALARAHMDLVPYFRIQAIAAHTSGTPPVLHPSMAYPDDAASRADIDAYLLGPDLFVAPVVTPGATTRAVHLPPGRWVHWYTGMEATGDVTVAAPIGTPAVFLRVGAIVPMLPGDLDTLAEEDVDTAQIVTPSQRPYLRARILPAGDRTITTEEGIAIHVTHETAPLSIVVTPDGTGLTDLRMRIDLDHAEPVIAPSAIHALATNGTDVPMAASAASVQSGCDGACWYLDGSTLWVSVRAASASTISTR
ncbi:MAG: glycoside hydrolase family 31 protein [Sandaracinus sp.]